MKKRKGRKGIQNSDDDRGIYMMKEPVRHSRSVILSQAELILSVVFRPMLLEPPACQCSRRLGGITDLTLLFI